MGSSLIPLLEKFNHFNRDPRDFRGREISSARVIIKRIRLGKTSWKPKGTAGTEPPVMMIVRVLVLGFRCVNVLTETTLTGCFPIVKFSSSQLSLP